MPMPKRSEADRANDRNNRVREVIRQQMRIQSRIAEEVLGITRLGFQFKLDGVHRFWPEEKRVLSEFLGVPEAYLFPEEGKE